MQLRLNALLITPVQRIPRYKMLLEDVIKNTPDCHPDKRSLKEALEQIDALAWHINDQVGLEFWFSHNLVICSFSRENLLELFA